MAERLTLEPEVQEIFQRIDAGKNFLLSGGAGSGKTYSLVQVIKQAIKENPNYKVACMTYTNAAVKQIEERVDHQNLFVSTIHDFLWDNIKHFQTELKTSLITLMNDEDSKVKSPEEEIINDNYFDSLKTGIQYKEYLRIKEGIISHDEVLILANHLFKTNIKLCDILKDKFKFIFIDEYQDTSKYVVEIFLNHINKSKKHNTIGFFGDSMQAIYESGIGNLNDYLGDPENNLIEVKKKQNRRNPQLVIDLANGLRTDGIKQEPSDDITAPNMVDGAVKQGDIKFYYSSNTDIEIIKAHTGWNFLDSKDTKILNLTHNLIAPKAGFKNLMQIYDKDPIIALKNDIVKKIKANTTSFLVEESDTFDQIVDKFQLKNRQRLLKKDILLSDKNTRSLYLSVKDILFSEIRKIYLDKDQLLDDKKQDQEEENKKGSKRDNLIKHLFKIQENISLYKNAQYNEFIRVTEYKIRSISDKKKLKERIEELVNVRDTTIEDIIEKADGYNICKKNDYLTDFIYEKNYVYNRVKSVKYYEFQKLYRYLEGYTPYSTQHKTKGAEFNNVLIILDNGGWNNYKFSGLFIDDSSERVSERTLKIFYVCCTRTKENLAVFFHDPSPEIIKEAKKIFGEANVEELC